MSEIQDCTSVISSLRALPSQANNPIHCEYLFTKGRIVNNVYDSKSGKYKTPKKEGCPFETTLNVPKTIAKIDCKDNLTGGVKCGEEEDKIYVLPSLVLMVQNNVDASVTPVTIEDAFCSFTSDTKLCLPGDCESSLCHDEALPALGELCGSSPFSCEDGRDGVIPFKPNGLFAAVYNIALWHNYQYFAKKHIYEFVVYPYKNSAACKPGNLLPCKKPEPRSCSKGGLIPPIVGTFPFCIGGKYSCACVNLLIHGATRRDDLSDGCLISDLHWVGVRLFFKNKENQVCSKNPASVHIQANKTDPLKDCFKPYFATTRQVITEHKTEKPSCPSYETDCEQQFSPPLIGEDGSYPNYPFPPCPIRTEYPDPCSGDRRCEVLDLIWVSDCIDFDEFTCFQTCKIFIVLLPTTRSKAIYA